MPLPTVALGTQSYFAFRISVMAKDKQIALVVVFVSHLTSVTLGFSEPGFSYVGICT